MLIILLIVVIVSVIAFLFMGNIKNDSLKHDGFKEINSHQTNKSKQKGQLGEQLVKGRGEKFLNPKIYIPFHNITIYNGEKTSQIDHIYLSIYGIFVIETKYYNGWIYGGQYDKFWTQTFKDQKFQFNNPIRQNYGHIKFLENFLTIDFEKFHSVVVFAGDGVFKTKMPKNVCQLDNFCDYILSFKEPIFTQNEIERLAGFLQSRFLPQTENALRFHIHQIKSTNS